MHLLPPAAAFLMPLCINSSQVEKEPKWWNTFILLSRDQLSGCPLMQSPKLSRVLYLAIGTKDLDH